MLIHGIVDIFRKMPNIKQLWKYVFFKYTKKVKILLDYLLKNKSITLSKYCKIAYISRKSGENILVNLILLSIIEMNITEKQESYSLLPDIDIEKAFQHAEHSK